ncbi:hypothetical protein KFU94_47820 [Chloroflexi bacterium TSY]|nr:hypothetical protein [Chloroflexi bacterium TSY]
MGVWMNDDSPILYGAISLGDIWRFGLLKRQERLVIQDIELYRVPTDLMDLAQILIGILNPSR